MYEGCATAPLQAQPYFQAGTNAGGDDEAVAGEAAALRMEDGLLAPRRRALVRALGEPAFRALVAKLVAAIAKTCPKEPPEADAADVLPTECERWMAAAEQAAAFSGLNAQPFSRKHCTQQAAIAGQMKRVRTYTTTPQSPPGAPLRPERHVSTRSQPRESLGTMQKTVTHHASMSVTACLQASSVSPRFRSSEGRRGDISSVSPRGRSSAGRRGGMV